MDKRDKIIEILQKRYQLEVEGIDEEVADEILSLVNEPVEPRMFTSEMGKVATANIKVMETNSLVSEPDEDNEPRHHISCVNCAIEWASQYEPDNEIAKRMIEEYEAWNRPQPTAYSLAGLKKWLDKKPYDPHEVAQMKKEMDLTNNGEGQ